MAYEGSSFYMSRDGANERYEAFHVPRDVERGWLAELTVRWVERLAEPGNWWSVSLLAHHTDFSYVAEVIASDPKGRLWERCAYLEHMLDYVSAAARRGQATRTDVTRAAERALALAGGLRRAAGSARSAARVDALSGQAESMLSSTG